MLVIQCLLMIPYLNGVKVKDVFVFGEDYAAFTVSRITEYCCWMSSVFVRLMRTTTGPNGEPAGSWATNPSELDKRIQDAWSPIYKGNVPPQNEQKHIGDFCDTYRDYIHITHSHHTH